MITNDSKLYDGYLKLIEEIQKMKNLDKRIIGFNFVVYGDEIFANPYLGPHAK